MFQIDLEALGDVGADPSQKHGCVFLGASMARHGRFPPRQIWTLCTELPLNLEGNGLEALALQIALLV